MKIISLFSGIGGLDLGFIKAGFDVIWANDFDKDAIRNYCQNIKIEHFDERPLEQIPFKQIPDNIEGIIAGMPGEGWAVSGSLNGIRNRKGQYMFDFIRMLDKKQPKFFIIETLPGFLYKYNRQPRLVILELIWKKGYSIYQFKLNAKHYGVPQDRNRVFIIGIKDDQKKTFYVKRTIKEVKTLKDSIYDLKDNAVEVINNKQPKLCEVGIPNHEYLVAKFSPLFMSRNRVRGWNEVSFTIQADRRIIPIHPNAPRMTKESTNKYRFKKGKEHLYRRFTIRECARLQSFDDNYILEYNTLTKGYHLIGNATPPKFAYEIAKQLLTYLS